VNHTESIVFLTGFCFLGDIPLYPLHLHNFWNFWHQRAIQCSCKAVKGLHMFSAHDTLFTTINYVDAEK